jgi:hypothetical protein
LKPLVPRLGGAIRIPCDATIDETKFTGYLLVQRPWDDKSGYLRRAGFELKNWPDLRAAIRRLTASFDVSSANEEFGIDQAPRRVENAIALRADYDRSDAQTAELWAKARSAGKTHR